MSIVKIVMSNHGRGEVFVDGAKLIGVKELSLKCAVGEANELTLKMIPDKIEVSGEFDVSTIESDSRELIARGEKC